MTIKLIVQPEAEADIRDAFDWYNARDLGLGDEFLGEAHAVFARIIAAPRQPRVRHRGTRRVRLRRFPYIVLYAFREETVFVLGVMHERRRPSVFRARTATSGKA